MNTKGITVWLAKQSGGSMRTSSGSRATDGSAYDTDSLEQGESGGFFTRVNSFDSTDSG